MAKGTTEAESAKSLGTATQSASPHRRDGDESIDYQPESPKKMLLQLGGAVLVAAIVLAAYGWYQKRSHAAKVLTVEALDLMEKMDVPSLRKAEAKLQEGLELQSSNPQALSTIAELYGLLWIEHGVQEAKAKAIDFTKRAVDKDIENEQRYAAEALVLYGEGKYEEADKLLVSVNERGAVSEQFYWVHALTDMARGRPEEAREKLRKAADLKSSTPHYARVLGDAYDDAADDRNALIFWDRSAKVNPAYIQGVARDLLTHIKNDFDRKAVLDELARFATLKPEDIGPVGQAAVAYVRALMLYQEAKYDEALNVIATAIDKAGETPRYLTARGRILVAAGKTEQGFKDLLAARQKAPKADRYLYTLTDTYLELGKTGEALKLLRSAGADRDGDSDYQVALGDALLAKGDTKAAKAAFKKALDYQSNHPYALLGQAKVAWKEHNFEGAMPWFEKAVSAKPKFPELYENIGLMWVDQGALTQANPQLDMAEKLYKATEREASGMKRFYATIEKAYASARGGSNYVKEWSERQKAYEEQLKNPVQAQANEQKPH